MLKTVRLFLLSSLCGLPVLAQNWENVTPGLPMGHQITSGSAGSVTNFFWVSGVGPSGGGGRLWVGLGPGGVYYSDNSGGSWTAANNGLTESFYGTTLTPRSFLETGTSVVRGGITASWNNHAGSAVFRSANNGASWTESNVPETADMLRLVQGGGRLYGSSTLSGVHYSADDGQTWTRWSTGLEVPFGLPAVTRALTYANGKVIAGADLVGIMASTDGGVTWFPSDNGIPLNPQLVYRSTVVPLDLVTTPSGIIYLLIAGESNADAKSVFRSTDNGASWSRVSYPGMFGSGGANNLWRMVNHGEDIIVGATMLGGTNAPCYLFRPANGWYALPTAGFTASQASGEAMTAVKNGYLFHTTGTNLYRLNLATAPLTPMPSKIVTIAGGGGINLGDSRTLVPQVHGTYPLSFQWYKDGVLIPGATTSNYTFTATGNDAIGTYALVVSNSGGSVTNNAVITTVAGNTLGTPDYSFSPGNAVINTFNANCSVICFPGSGFSYTMVRLPDGKIVVGGGFNAVGIPTGGAMAASEMTFRNSFIRLNSDGTLDTTFQTGTGPDNAVRQVVALPDGRLLVCGPFQSFNGVPAKHIVRLNADGSVDRSFNPSLSADWEIIALLPLPDGRILAGGSFNSFDQRGQGRLVVLRADGSLDESFALPQMLNGTVQQIVRQTDGKILIAGGFSGLIFDPVNPLNQYGPLIRLNADLTVDLAFRPSSLPTYVNAIGVLPDGRILAGGSGQVRLYSAAGVQDNTFNPGSISGWVWDIKPLGASNILIAANRLHIRGTNGTSVMDIDTSADITYSTLVEPDGRILVAEGGNSTMSWGGVRRFRGVELDQAIISEPMPIAAALGGSATFSVNVRGAGPFTFQWRKNGTNIVGATASVFTVNSVSAADVANYSCAVSGPGGAMISASASLTLLGAPSIAQQPVSVNAAVGDSFRLTVRAIGSAPITYQWKKNGSVLTGETNQTLTFGSANLTQSGTYTVDVTAAGSTVGSSNAVVNIGFIPGAVDLAWIPSTTQGTNLALRSVARQNDGKILVAGSAANNRGVFRLNTNGSYDATFVTTNTLPGSAVAVAADGKILAAFGNTPNLFVTRLQANGATDLTFSNVSLSGAQAFFAKPQVNEIRELPDGRILVLGGFTHVNGSPRTNIVRLFANGVVDTNFIPAVVGGYSDGAQAGYSSTLSDGRLLVQNVLAGGSMGSLHRLNLDGQIELIYGMTNTASQVRAAAYQPDGKLVVALSEGVNQRLTRYNVNGSIDTSFASPLLYKGNSYRVAQILVQPGGRIVALGFISRMDGTTVTALASNWISGVVAVNSDGTLDQAFNRFTGLEANSLGYKWVNAALAMPDGRILAVGEFASWNGQPRHGLAMLFDTQIDPAFNQQITSYTFNQGDNMVLNPLPFSAGNAAWQWQRNGTNLVGQTGPTLALNGVLPTDSGVYTLIGTSPYGTNRFSFEVVVLGKPQILVQPVAPPAVVANPFQLLVKAIGVAPLAYQWRKDGTNLPGAMFATYTNLNAALTDSGTYDVIIQNALGSATSSVAIVTVITQPGSLSLGISNNLAGVSRIVKERSGSFLLHVNSSLTRLSQAGTFDTAFSNTLRAAMGSASVSSMLTDEFGRVYIATSSPHQVRRFLSNGSADTNFPTLSLGSQANSIALAADGSLFIATGVSAGLTKYLPTGVPDTLFNAAVATSLSGFGVLTVEVQPDGKVFAALSNSIRRLNADGTLDATFAVNNINNVRGFLPLPDGRYYVWGSFNGGYSVNNVSTTLRQLTRFLPGGLVDPTFLAPSFTGAVYSISPQQNGRIIMVGSFATVDSVSRPYVVRLQSNGAVDTTFNTGAGPNGIVMASGLLGDGRVLIGGSFSQVNSIARSGLAVLNGDIADLSFTGEPVSVVLNHGEALNLTGSAVGTSAINYQWLRNGASIANGTSYSVPSVTTNEAGLYQLVISNLSGSKTSAVASVTVLANPIFLKQPLGTNGYLYKSVTFAPEVRGRAPVSYQWFRDGFAITNQGTNITLTLTNLLFADAGNYTLVASNSLGVSTSAVANLTVSILHGSVDLAFDAKTFVNGGNGLTMLADGRFYVAANYVSNFVTLSRAVTRLLPDGRFDPTFVQTNINVAAPRFMLIDSQGRLVCVTSSSVYRLLPNGNFDSTWGGTNLGLSHPNIYAAALQPDGKLLLGGSYTSPRSYLFRLDENGKFDPTFNPNAYGAVYGLKVMNDDSILVGATFNPNIRIQRFLPDGTDYPGWTVPQYGGQLVGPTRFFELPDGKILAGGTWAVRVQRFMPDGTVDPTFISPGANPSATSYFEMLREPDGKIVIAGDFTTWNGFNVNGFVRLHPNGQYDSNFVGGATSPMQPLGLGQQYDGRLILVGNFTTFDGAARPRVAGAFSTPVTLGITNVPASQIANLNGTVNITATGWSATGANLAYQWYRNGSLIAGATSATLQIVGIQKSQAGVYTVVITDGTNSVTSPGAQVTVLAEPVFVVQPSSLVTTQGFNVAFSPVVTGVQPMSFQWRQNGTPVPNATNLQLNLSSVTLANAGAYTLTASNSVGTATSVTAYLTVGSLAAGNLDITFHTNSTGPNQSVSHLLNDTNGNRIIVGGAFTSFNGQSRQRLAWLETQEGLLLGTNGPSIVSINSLGAHTNGGLLVGGSFSTVAGQSRIGFARLQPNAQLDTTWTNIMQSSSSVQAIHVYPDGSALIGGGFRTAGGILRSNMARLTPEGFVDASFGAPNIANNSVLGMAVQPDGKIMIVGNFTLVHGVGRTNCARLNADGSLDNTFTNASVNTAAFSSITHVALQSDGKIVIAGTFNQISGQSRTYIARLNSDGSLDTGFNPNFNSTVTALAVLPDDKLLVGGAFTFVNGVSQPRLVRLITNGTTDTSFNVGSGPDQQVSAIVPLPDGKVLIGGFFNSYNGVSRRYLARLLGNGQLAPVIVAQPDNVSAAPNTTVSFSVAAGGLNPLRFQWRFNGTNLIGRTNFSLTLNAIATNHAGDYSVVITNSFGAVTSSVASLTITGGSGSAFAAWAVAAGLNAGNNQPGQDADNDGLANAFEYYFGSNPTSASPGASPAATTVNVSGTNYPAITFIRSKTANGVTLLSQASSNVLFSDSLGTTIHSVTDLGNGTERVVIRSVVGVSITSRQFLRIQLTVP